MTSMSNMGMTLAELEQLLDVYGGDRVRWPAEARTGAAQLVARDAGARRLLAEAEALDRVLERAPLPAVTVEAALAERIVAAAQRSPRIVKLEESRPAAVATAAGIVLGDSDLTPQLLPELVDMTGLSADSSGLVQVALSDEVTQ